MNNNNGWIKLHRQLLETSFYKRSTVVHLFIHLLLSANHESKKLYWNGEEIEVKAGEQIVGLLKLSEETGISIQSLRTALKVLKSTSTLTIKSTNKFSLIGIPKWHEFQGGVTTISTSKLTNNQQTTNKQLTTNNNDKNDKNEKKHIQSVEKNSKNSTTACTDEELRAISRDMKCDYKSVVLVHESIMDLIQAGEFKHKTVYFTLRNWLRMRIEKGTLQISKPTIYESNTEFDPLRD
jgi:predicted transcriptional regulator